MDGTSAAVGSTNAVLGVLDVDPIGRPVVSRVPTVVAVVVAPHSLSRWPARAATAAHVTAGEFDWVLSKIEQDDSYQG